MAKYNGLTVICNGCGEPMRDFGEWPVVYPKTEKPASNMQQASRYCCQTCRIPSDKYSKGLPVMATIIEHDLTQESSTCPSALPLNR